jgi:hypothetical protein
MDGMSGRFERTGFRSSVDRVARMRRGLSWAIVAAVIASSQGARSSAQDCEFVRGDVNRLDGLEVVDGNDAVDILAYLYLGVSVPVCPDAADIDDNGIVEPGDYAYLVQFLFNDGPPPPAPYPGRGVDPTPGITLPEARDERFRFSIASAAGVPSQSGIALPVRVTNSEPILSLQMVLEYNQRDAICPDLLIQEIRTEEGTLLSQESSEYIIAEFDNIRGVAFIAALKDFATPFFFQSGESGFLPAGDDQLVATIVLAVAPCADKGPTSIGFSDGAILASDSLSEPGLLAAGHNVVIIETGAVRPVLGEAGSIDVRQGFIRGDANKDDSVDIGDPVFLLDYVFRGGRVPPCIDAADANNDTDIDISDPIWLLTYLFTGGPQPSEPYPQAGVDPSDDGRGSLGCESDR